MELGWRMGSGADTTTLTRASDANAKKDEGRAPDFGIRIFRNGAVFVESELFYANALRFL